MKKYYVTVHRDEDQKALLGQDLDMCNAHMVFDSGYDDDVMRDIVKYHPYKVIWVMSPSQTAKFGWKFMEPFGIPR